MNHGHEMRDLWSKTRKRNKRGQGLKKILKLVTKNNQEKQTNLLKEIQCSITEG